MRTEQTVEQFMNNAPSMTWDKLLEGLQKAHIFYFRYFPKLKLDIVPESTCKAWRCKPYYEDMPESMAREFIAEIDHPQFIDLYKKIDEGEPSVSAVFRFKDLTTWARVTLTTVAWDEDNKPEECIAIVENLSDSKRIETEFSKQNQMLSTIMQVFQVTADVTGSIVFIFDYERKSILVTDSTASQWGVLTEQFGVPYEVAKSDIVPEASKEEYIKLHEQMLNGAQRAQGKLMLRDASGTLGYYELTLQALYDEDGTPLGKAAGIYKNITEYQKNMMHQFSMTKALSEGLSSVFYIDFASDSFIIEKLANDVRSSAIEFVMDFQNCKFSEAMEYYCRELICDDDREMMAYELSNERILERLHEKGSYYLQYRVKGNGDNREFFEIHLTNSIEDGDGKRAFISFRCIDEQKKKEIEHQHELENAYESTKLSAEAANMASAAKSDFLSHMSHDMRTPINVIIGMAGLANMYREDTERVQDCLDKILSASQHLLGIVNNVLDMSKIEAGKEDLNAVDFDMHTLVETLVDMAKPQMEAMNHTFDVSVQEITHNLVVGDCQRIQQAFMNLISNSVKYTPKGGRISLTVTELPASRSDIAQFEFVLSDNGIGMTKEFQERLFEPFSRETDSRVSKQQGTGLGMTITRNIVRMMNGDIKVESAPNEGTTFTVTIILPIQRASDSEQTGEPVTVSGNSIVESLHRMGESDFGGKRILLVEDNDMNAEIAMEILRMVHVEVDRAQDGEEAVNMMREAEDGYYNLVFMDIQMPKMNGYEATAAIRDMDREYLKTVPIVAMSANAFKDDIESSKAAGMNGHVSKPLEFARLNETLNTWLK